MFNKWEMKELVAGLRRDLVTVSLLCRDAKRATDGVNLILPVDFSEIFAHMYGRVEGTRLMFEARVLLSEVFDHGSHRQAYQLTVLPATIWEILRHLEWVRINMLHEGKAALAQILERDEVKRFIQRIEEHPEEALDAYAELGGTTGAIATLTDAALVAEVREPLERFIALVEGNCLLPIEDILPSIEHIQVDSALCDTICGAMWKSGRAAHNPADLADASNYSLTLAINDATYKDGNYFAMLMRPQAPKAEFDQHPWKNDPLAGYIEAVAPVATREPSYCHRAITAALAERNPKKRLAMLERAHKQTKELLESLGDRAAHIGKQLQALDKDVFTILADEARDFLDRFFVWDRETYAPLLELLHRLRPGKAPSRGLSHKEIQALKKKLKLLGKTDMEGAQERTQAAKDLIARADAAALVLLRDRNLLREMHPDLPPPEELVQEQKEEETQESEQPKGEEG